MKPWKQYLLLNSFVMFLIACSVFVVPANVPFRLWATTSGFGLAVLNVVLYRHLSRPKTSIVFSLAPLFALALLIAEGGWQQMVAYVAIAVSTFAGAIMWVAKRTTHED